MHHGASLRGVHPAEIIRVYARRAHLRVLTRSCQSPLHTISDKFPLCRSTCTSYHRAARSFSTLGLKARVTMHSPTAANPAAPTRRAHGLLLPRGDSNYLNLRRTLVSMAESRAASSVGGVIMTDLPAECSVPTSALVGVSCRENIALMLINAYICGRIIP
jgi:hypothetical protein